MSIARIKNQPPVFKLSFFTTMCERFGYYVLSFLLVLYAKAVFGFSDQVAFALYAIFTALAYLATAMGGYLADNVLGIRRCLIFGLFFESIGMMLLALPNRFFFPISLAFIIVGVGLFKTAPTHLLGRSYEDKDPRIDSGFTLYYMAINIGTFVSSLLIGVVQKIYGWHVAFFVGGAGIFVGLAFYFIFKSSAKKCDSAIGKLPMPTKKWAAFFAGIIVLIVICSYLIFHKKIAYSICSIACVFLLFYFFYEMAVSKKEDRDKIIACLLLILMGFVFFVLYQQAYTSIELFVERSVQRHIFGITIPTVAFFSLNAIWILILGPILAWFYHYLEQNGKIVAITTKFPVGLLVTTLCFFTLRIGGYFANSQGLVSPFWVVLAYFFYTLGEMLVSALGVAMITHIAPKKLYGVMMGTWFFVGMSMSAILSGFIANLASVPTTILHSHFGVLAIYEHAFYDIGMLSLVAALASFIAAPYIKRIASLD